MSYQGICYFGLHFNQLKMRLTKLE